MTGKSRPEIFLPLAAAALWLTAGLAEGAESPAISSLPYSPGLDVTAMDRSVDPCQDFYTYSCGGWIAANPIPGDESAWDVFSKLQADNERYLLGLLEARALPDDARSPNEQKIGDYFASCMDTASIEAGGHAPLAPMLARIAAINAPADLARVLADLHNSGSNWQALFAFTSLQDLEDSRVVVGTLFAGGLGLPDRDYYTDDTPRMHEARERYQAHIARMLGLLGDTPESAATAAGRIFALEVRLAEATLTREESRDLRNLNNPMSAAELAGLAPAVDWQEYFAARKAPAMQRINVTEPAFLRAVSAVLAQSPIEDVRNYLRWAYLNGHAALLSRDLADADFDFYGRYLRGVAEQPPRWKSCVRRVDRQLGDALGQVFVAATFSTETRARAVTMAETIEQMMAERIRNLDWMSEATKRQALAKLGTVRNKIGYPDKWRDYATLEVTRGDFFGNVVRAAIHDEARELAKIGKPADPDEWFMTPQTVNAFYDPQLNTINFPAAVLQPPLFDPRIDAAPSWGNTGSTIGHELTHGFDDSGRHIDERGNLRDWWTEEDAAQFEQRTQCLIDQYGQYEVVDDLKVNSELTVGEDLADLGGTLLAYMGWKAATAGQALETRDGLDPDQRFFVGFAQWACGHMTDETARLWAATAPYAPLKHRVNGVVVNLPEFAEAFHCKAGDAMVKPAGEVCRIW